MSTTLEATNGNHHTTDAVAISRTTSVASQDEVSWVPPGLSTTVEPAAEEQASQQSRAASPSVQRTMSGPPTPPATGEAEAPDQPIVYYTAPVEYFPSPKDTYSPTPELECQPFRPVKSPSPPPELRDEIEKLKGLDAANPPRLATPYEPSTTAPRATPPLYSPKFPPSPTLLKRFPDTWLEEVLISVERRRSNLLSELADAKADVNESLAESHRALIMMQELLGEGGLMGILEILEKDHEAEMKASAQGKGKQKAEVPKEGAEEEPQWLAFMRLLTRMVGITMVRKMIIDARQVAEADNGDDEDDEEMEGEDRDRDGDGDDEDADGSHDDGNDGGEGRGVDGSVDTPAPDNGDRNVDGGGNGRTLDAGDHIVSNGGEAPKTRSRRVTVEEVEDSDEEGMIPYRKPAPEVVEVEAVTSGAQDANSWSAVNNNVPAAIRTTQTDGKTWITIDDDDDEEAMPVDGGDEDADVSDEDTEDTEEDTEDTEGSYEGDEDSEDAGEDDEDSEGSEEDDEDDDDEPQGASTKQPPPPNPPATSHQVPQLVHPQSVSAPVRQLWYGPLPSSLHFNYSPNVAPPYNPPIRFPRTSDLAALVRVQEFCQAVAEAIPPPPPCIQVPLLNTYPLNPEVLPSSVAGYDYGQQALAYTGHAHSSPAHVQPFLGPGQHDAGGGIHHASASTYRAHPHPAPAQHVENAPQVTQVAFDRPILDIRQASDSTYVVHVSPAHDRRVGGPAPDLGAPRSSAKRRRDGGDDDHQGQGAATGNTPSRPQKVHCSPSRSRVMSSV